MLPRRVVQEDSNGAERPVYRQKRPKKRKSPLQIPFPEGGTTLCFRSKDKIKGISLCRKTVYFIQNHILKNKKSSLLFSWTTKPSVSILMRQQLLEIAWWEWPDELLLSRLEDF